MNSGDCTQFFFPIYHTDMAHKKTSRSCFPQAQAFCRNRKNSQEPWKHRSCAVNSIFSPDKEYLKWFAALSAIPHESGNEQKLSDFLVDFAHKRGLFVAQDAIGNVLIKKPGTPGMEHAPAVILQGHMDMVCVKEEGLKFDFANDSLTLMTDGENLFAQGTSLGADNGIALAYILAVLDADDIPHPPLEAVVTVQEETGMGGAVAFDVSSLDASLFLNMDSEEEGIFCVSCAGGKRSRISIPVAFQDAAALSSEQGWTLRRITLGGLAGGHSGLEIIRERGNSNRLLARMLDSLASTFPCRLASLHGGTAANAIPRESSAVLFIKAEDEAVMKEVKRWEETFRHELRGSDGAGLFISMDRAEGEKRVLAPESEKRVLAAAMLVPDGIASMDKNITTQNLVESSNNFAMIRMEGEKVVFHCQTRSSVASRKEDICRRIEILGALVGGSVEHSGDYPAWEYNPDSRLEAIFTQAYEALFQKKARVEGIHAGLECGLFADKFLKLGRKVDFISFGPTVTGAHSTKETLNLASAEHAWNLLKDVLRRIGEDR